MMIAFYDDSISASNLLVRLVSNEQISNFHVPINRPACDSDLNMLVCLSHVIYM